MSLWHSDCAKATTGTNEPAALPPRASTACRQENAEPGGVVILRYRRGRMGDLMEHHDCKGPKNGWSGLDERCGLK